MAAVTVRNLPDDVHRALRARALRHGRSTEAEIREILGEAVKPAQRVRLGSHLMAIARMHGLHAGDADLFERDRKRKPAEPTDFK
jgi:plasmid stability protein